MKRRRFDEGGGVREGANTNIDDDVRARALAWVKKQQEGGGDEPAPAPRVKAKAKATPAPIPALTTAPESKRGGASPDDIPGSDYKLREGRGNPIVSESDLSRNLDNTATAISPFALGPAAALRAVGKAGKALKAYGGVPRLGVEARAAALPRAAKAPPRIGFDYYPPTVAGGGPNMKKGGAVKAFAKGGSVGRGDGIARKGKTKGRMV